MKITKMHWGTAEGREVFLFDIIHPQGIHARVSNFGGVLQSLFVKDACGNVRDMVLGYDALEDYLRDETFFGAMIGPIADRLGGGRCVLDGEAVQLPLNAGPDCMHSGPCGFHDRVWDWEVLEDGICLHRRFQRGETGFPGVLEARICWRVTDRGTLRVEYRANCDRETALSFTNHSYFNIDGCADSCRKQVILVHASRYAQTEREIDPICTGRALPVDGTPFDLRGGRKLEDVLAEHRFREIQTGGGIDHYFLVDGDGMREHARLESARSGIRLTCRSDAPGVLVYTGNGLADEKGKDGAVYRRNWGVCLETQRFPNAVNQPDWREQVLVKPGEIYETATEFQFSYI